MKTATHTDATAQQDLPFDPKLRWATLHRAIDNLPQVVIADSIGRKRRYTLDSKGERRQSYAAKLHRVLEMVFVCGGNNHNGCRARLALLSAKSGLSIDTVREYLKEAEALGWITVERDRFLESGGGQISNHYAFDWTRIRQASRVQREQQMSLFLHSKPGSEVTTPPSEDTRPPSYPTTPPSEVTRAYNKEVVPLIVPEKNPEISPPPPSGAVSQAGGGGSFEIEETKPEKRPFEENHGWNVVVSKLMKLGVVAGHKACKRAFAAGMTPAGVNELIEHYTKNAGVWGPGALKERIENSSPSVNPGACWPPAHADYKSPEDLQREAEEKRLAAEKRSAELAARARREEVATQTMLSREERYGPILDSMSEEEVAQLAESLGPVVGRSILKCRACDRKRVHRLMLLDALEAREGGAGGGN